jgi:MFS family permease
MTGMAPAVDRVAGTGLLAVTCVSTLVVNANTSAVAILLPAISADVGTPVTTLQWAVTGYSLVGAAVIVTSGALGDVFGRRRIFLAGLLLFVVSCVLIALSRNGAGVIAGRAVQGAAGATILACGLSLLSAGSSGRGQLRAVSLWGAAAAVGAALGPLAGGVLVDVAGWPALFWIDAVIAAACLPAARWTVAESSDPTRPRSIDILGTIGVAAVLTPFILAVSEGGDWGWFSPATLGCLLVSGAAAVALVMVEKRVSAPLVDLKLLRNRVLMAATLGILIGSGTINALMYLFSVYSQDPATLAMSPFEAGLATLPITAALVVTATTVVGMVARRGTRMVVATGFGLSTVGFAVLGLVHDSWSYTAFVLPLTVVAVGMGLSNGPCSSASTAAVAPTQVGSASGISNMARYVGTAVLTAVAASVYGSASAAPGEAPGAALSAGFARGSIVLAVVSAAGVAVAMLAGRHRLHRPGTLDYAAASASSAHTLPVYAPRQ